MKRKESKAVNRGIDTTELLMAMDELEKTNGIKKDFLMKSIETALVVAYKRNFDCQNENVKVVVDKTDGKMHVYQEKTVVEDVNDSKIEISLEEAKKKDKKFEVGDVVQFELMPKDFGRIAAQTAKQVITQKIREASRDVIFTEFADKKGEIITGLVQKSDGGTVILDLGRIEGILPKKEQIPTEVYNVNDKIKTCIISVEKGVKGSTQIILSRASTEFVRKLFEIEIPEIYEGLIEIKNIARDAGSRSKIAVYSPNPNIDPVGSCVGQKGIRIQNIINELNGEKIDVIEWDPDLSTFISTALLPAKVLAVDVRDDGKFAQVIVPDDQLSLAIGKAGQNARLAARLTDLRIDIKSKTQFAKMLEEMQNEKDNPEANVDDNVNIDVEKNEDLEQIEESDKTEEKKAAKKKTASKEKEETEKKAKKTKKEKDEIKVEEDKKSTNEEDKKNKKETEENKKEKKTKKKSEENSTEKKTKKKSEETDTEKKAEKSKTEKKTKKKSEETETEKKPKKKEAKKSSK